MRNTILVLLALAGILLVVISLRPVQQYVAQKAVRELSARLKTHVSVGNVRLSLLNQILIEDLLIEDHARDTLLFAGEARLRITDWFFLRNKKPVVSYVGLHDAYVHLYRGPQNDVWNYQFVLDAFNTGPRDPTKKQNTLELDLRRLDLQRVRFFMDDAWAGQDLDMEAGSLQLNARNVDLVKKILSVQRLELEGGKLWVRDYKGGRPARPKRKRVIDTTAFNPGNWAVSARHLLLDDCAFFYETEGSTPALREFDPEHMAITGINLDARHIRIQQDTLTGRIAHLSAAERSGIKIRQMNARVTVSPNASICEDLYLETNNSRLGSYYAMHYERFPDFQDYIHKVRMVARLDDARIDARDVAYFAPVLRQWPVMLRATGNVTGTVDHLKGRNLDLTDGATTIRGDIRMDGLPDIYTTLIDFRDGEVLTSGPALMRYGPGLKNHPNIDLSKLTHAYFKGNFLGYIESFATNGVLATNLGTITSDIKLRIPAAAPDQASYDGLVQTANFRLGGLLRQPLLGAVSLKANVSGKGFSTQGGSLRLKAFISRLELNNYNYQNIQAEGELQRRKFDGRLVVDDPNLALAFYGSMDFSQKTPAINATANLLKSDFRALNLSRDTLLASADFDLNASGSNLDNFLGSARLYNINLLHNNHRLDLDSVYVHVTENDQKVMTIESNALSASIAGNYQLSSLPYSAQYYLSGYLPNYIRAPRQHAPPQDLRFEVVTRDMDSLLVILAPHIRGFNDASLSGSLNTTEQALGLQLRVPFGSMGNVHLNQVSVSGAGNFRNLILDAQAASMRIGDSILDISVEAHTVLGNDSLRFRLATASPYTYGTATINGEAYASGDSLYLTLQPSELMLNQTRWEIPAGNRTILSPNYLHVHNLILRSGPQLITFQSATHNRIQQLDARFSELDIAQLGGIFNLQAYEPDGRLNGTVSLVNPFGKYRLSADLQASSLRLGNDTIGDVVLQGAYDDGKRQLVLAPHTGIFRGSSALKLSGALTLDSNSNQKLDGSIQVVNAPLAWINPFVSGYLSQVQGLVNGTISIGGTAAAPDTKGQLRLSDASMRIDYLGTVYNIPEARFHVTSEALVISSLPLYDVLGNRAEVTGRLQHHRLRRSELNFQLQAPKLEVLNLQDFENRDFYGHLIAEVQSMSVRGPIDNIRMNIRAKAAEAEKSHLYIPVTSGGEVGSYSFIRFKQYGEEQQPLFKSKDRLNIFITGIVTPDLETTLILDQTTGDQINAIGSGNINLDIATGHDIGISGKYEIDRGDYTFTFRQLFFKRRFLINAGSSIFFNGNINNTVLNVKGTYRTYARLYDLLTETEINSRIVPEEELAETKRRQNVDILLDMSGKLTRPELTFKLDLPEKRSVGTYAYTKLERINMNDRELFDQVASLLLIGYFMPPEGIVNTSAAKSGAVNNISEIVSTTASGQLTNLVNRLLGDKNLAIDLQYKNYNLSDQNQPGSASGVINRNELRVGLRQNLFRDRLIVELGTYYDWGKATTSNSNTQNLNFAGDFRAQYLITQDGRLRLNLFRTSSYDVLVDKNINRGGAGISWRRTFDNLDEFFGRNTRRSTPADSSITPPAEPDSLRRIEGTW